MAKRPVFVPFHKAPFVDVHMPEFSWNGGFADSQKQKNISALHEAFLRHAPGSKVLEISSKSQNKLGVALSAFNLKKYVPSMGYSIPVECVFQGGKTFENGGPYTDLYSLPPIKAKRDQRLRESGKLCSFFFEGQSFPLVPRTIFYNWLYISALLEHPEYAEQLMQYDGFTDIEFNPEKSINCQAEAAAVFVALSRQGLLDRCSSFEDFASLM